VAHDKLGLLQVRIVKSKQNLLRDYYVRSGLLRAGLLRMGQLRSASFEAYYVLSRDLSLGICTVWWSGGSYTRSFVYSIQTRILQLFTVYEMT
jgi:hypothetical protein